MQGISDKAVKANYAENKYRFNSGNELNNKEFSDGSGLELYDAVHRMYDPQLGRFGQIDPLGDVTSYMSPYGFASDNPISHFDPSGLTDTVVTTKTTDLPAVYVNAKTRAKWFYWPGSTKSKRQTWARNQGTYADRLHNNQPLSQKGDPASYTSSLGMYKHWTQEEKNYRAMQAWAVGIIASPALIATSPAEIGVALTAQRFTAVAIDASIQTAVNAMLHKNVFSNYNFVSGAASFLIGAPEGASLSDLAQVNLLNSTISTSINVSSSSVFGPNSIFTFDPRAILINAAFGTAAGKYSQFIGNGSGAGDAFGDAAASPMNLAGAVGDETTKPKEQQ
ncbi:MAG: hypothetical protein JST47_13515 [Bacteroidetes bacterium]|nr:hypothetical protein [Bacteroidota bacterium]MBS1975614.1 hypothetical protein [Bacteroidota bacterium]